jgi:hypothetical protein
MDEYEVDQFGHARFPQSKKGFFTTIDCFGRIKGIDRKLIFFVDNDDFPYLAEKKDFKFEKQEFKIK